MKKISKRILIVIPIILGVIIFTLFYNKSLLKENTKLNNSFNNPNKGAITNYTKNIDNKIITLDIFEDWQYEEITPTSEDDFQYALQIYKGSPDENVTLYFYNMPFAVCGTGLIQKKIKLNDNTEGSIGYYNEETWDFVSFTKENNIAFINNNLKNEEALESLAMIKTFSVQK